MEQVFEHKGKVMGQFPNKPKQALTTPNKPERPMTDFPDVLKT